MQFQFISLSDTSFFDVAFISCFAFFPKDFQAKERLLAVYAKEGFTTNLSPKEGIHVCGKTGGIEIKFLRAEL